MKKTILLYFSLLCTSLLYFSCEKQEIHVNTTGQLIEEARTFFKTTNYDNSLPASSVSILRSLTKIPIWDNGYVKTTSIGNAVVIPLHFNQNLSFRSSLSGQYDQKLDDAAKLVMYKDISGRFKMEVVIYFSDSNYLSGHSKVFSGIASVEDWNGNSIKSFRYTENGIRKISKQRKIADDNLQTNYVQQSGTTCYWQDVYRCKVYDGYSYDCRLLYTEFLGCEDNYDGPPIYGGSGGGPDVGDYPNLHSPSYHYQTQEEQDEEWMENNVKDNTNNPCVKKVLESLKAMTGKLPAVMRDFFSENGNFTMTFEMENISTWTSNGMPPAGAHTIVNTTSNAFQIRINSYYDEITDLGLAATIIHEAFHCQLMNWFREAVVNNDQARKEQLAKDYGYVFGTEITDIDNSLANIVNGGNPAQHQDVVNRYQESIAKALKQYADLNQINVTLDHCKKLAWVGTFDSKAFNDLRSWEQENIRDAVNAEKDPTSKLTDGTSTVNENNISAKGQKCKK